MLDSEKIATLEGENSALRAVVATQGVLIDNLRRWLKANQEENSELLGEIASLKQFYGEYNGAGSDK